MPLLLQRSLRINIFLLTFLVLPSFSHNDARAGGVKATNDDRLKNVEFDASFLNVTDEVSVDLSRFANSSAGTPGIHNTAIYINEQFISSSDIEFRMRQDKSVYPCLTLAIIKNINFNHDKLPANFLNFKPGESCFDLQSRLPDSQVSYDSNEQRLYFSIPQIYMQKMAKGTVSPELWDRGSPAIMMSYNVNGYSSESNGQTLNSLFAGLNAGLNVGAWYLRHNGSFTESGSRPGSYNNINTYFQHDIPELKARVLVGQSNTIGDLFDTLPLSGVQLITDDRMLPESLRGYAPEIRGIARTNARVTVRQGSQILYETSVSPGTFLINDLYPTGYGGDLNVTVHEADGSEQNFSVPYAAVAQLLRSGSYRYAITAGELRSDSVRGKPALYQMTYQLGLTNSLTGYTGLQLSQDYYALQLGTAVGTPVGALSFDVTQARTHLGFGNYDPNLPKIDNTKSGQSYQVSYSKLINEINGNISLAAYRFSTDGYMDFMTAMQSRDAVNLGFSPDDIWRAKNRMTLTYGQGLSDSWGQLYVSGSIQNYWNKTGADKQYQIGYNNRYRQISWGISASRSYSNIGYQQTSYLLSFSLPLSSNDERQKTQFHSELSYDTNGHTGQQMSVSGTGGKENQFTYGATLMHANQGTHTAGTLSGNYRSPFSSMNMAVSTGENYYSTAAGISGTLVGHIDGITFSPYTSDTFALVEAKGAKGAKVSSYPGVQIDSRGYALVPNLTPYQFNDVSIDPKGMSDKAELINTSQRIAPYSGAVVKVKYETKIGTAILISATWKGEPVPFGADVLDSQGNVIGYTGQGGQIYARVTDAQGYIYLRWGYDSSMKCSLTYELAPESQSVNMPNIQKLNSVCK